MNRLKERLGEQPEVPEPEGDYWEVQCRYLTLEISAFTARAIERVLDQAPPPRWVVFRDLTGARHRVLTELVTRVSESTAAQRTAQRAFERARSLEEKADRRPWEDD